MESSYVVVMPVRDEAAHLSQTLASLAQQTLLPTECLVVDDGSKDNTAVVVEQAARRLPWLRLVRRGDRGFRQAGGGVMEAFYEGFHQLQCTSWQFIVKLDGDLLFGPEYFARCLSYFAREPRLGIAGGQIYVKVDGQKKAESSPRFHVRGATKIYRRPCWDDIGGLKITSGWDTIDEVTANMRGWQTRSLVGEEICQLRPTGTTDGLWYSNVKYGKIAYLCGYHPVFLWARCLHRLLTWPYGLCALGMAYGYCRSWLQHLPRPVSAAVARYVHQQQWRRLTGRSSIWR